MRKKTDQLKHPDQLSDYQINQMNYEKRKLTS